MNSFKLAISCLTIVVFGLVSVGRAQMKEPGVTNADYKTIQQLVDQYLNKNLKVIGIVNFDSAKTSEYWVFEKPIRDPYGTLRDCYMFFVSNRFNSSNKEVEDRIGIFKNEEILWLSNSLINSTNFAGGNLKGAMDLNKDGIVEIWVALYHGMQGQSESSLIYEWNGNRAELISNTNDDGQSIIKMRRESSELIDIEPDGVLEIKGKGFDGKPVLYSWNGQKYGDWGISLPDQLPRDGIDVEVDAIIKKKADSDELIFNYTVKNKSESVQHVEEFALKNLYSNTNNKSSPKNWEFKSLNTMHIVGWQASKLPTALLEVGNSYSSFSFEATGLPRPSTYFVKGNNGDLSYDANDLINNSVSGTTLGSYSFLGSVKENAVIDSLITYQDQACNLKWITQKGICNSLKKKLDNVKRHLKKGKEKTARNVLTAYINQVKAQKDKHLTSEGYGLLFFNAEYLKNQLSKESPGKNK
ncbi:FIMAH domain-containing protein [Fodinibius saliphilus]|uniref:FIMAH domain-containing protein n=1 Tax=Fodinibius saliphilus TaxID=1920650 RepID=UPI001107D0BC|nr:hypothetical protein [Fodinibius saliphilus]